MFTIEGDNLKVLIVIDHEGISQSHENSSCLYQRSKTAFSITASTAAAIVSLDADKI